MKITLTKRNIFSIVIAGIALAGIILFFVIGNVTCNYDTDSLQLHGSLNDTVTIKFADVANLEFRDEFNEGIISFGFTDFKVSCGRFTNDEFHTYHLFRYNSVGKMVIITTSSDDIYCFNLDTEEKTLGCYNNLVQAINAPVENETASSDDTAEISTTAVPDEV